jgi:serine/threonine protein kinase
MEHAIDNDKLASLPTLASGAPAPDEARWLSSFHGRGIGALHRVVRHLASGGMGHVFLVEHIQLGAYAAAKIPQPGSSIARSVLSHEAVLLSRLQHPHIVSVLDFGSVDEDTEYMLMEYVRGIELDAWLESHGSMAPARAVGVLQQVAAAVDYLHLHDIVHCDIKPANIMLDAAAQDFVKLIDFGIACQQPMQAERRGLIGTPAYMAPEQARGELCGPAVDVYGVAALALELLTGRPPHDCASAEAALSAVLTKPPELPSARGVDAPGLDAVFERGLHSDPAARYPTATAFVEALAGVFHAAATRRTGAMRALGSDAASALAARPSSPAPALEPRSQGRRASWLPSAARGLAAYACAAMLALLRV